MQVPDLHGNEISRGSESALELKHRNTHPGASVRIRETLDALALDKCSINAGHSCPPFTLVSPHRALCLELVAGRETRVWLPDSQREALKPSVMERELKPQEGPAQPD